MALLIALSFASCGRNGNSTTGTATVSNSGASPAPASYTPRIGIAVSTAARSCLAIHNGDLTSGTIITLISPISPVSFAQGEIGGVAQQPCPITQNVDTTVSNYTIKLKNPVEKQTPMIAVVGAPAIIVSSNNVAQADLDQNGHTESFRACGTGNGIHFTVWNGAPLTGTLLWQGEYYDPSGASGIPACTPREVPAS
jgi:hypothetical protein